MNAGKSTELIIVKQLPIIEERVRSLSEEIDKQVTAATSLVCTEETVKSVKTVRADLNKQFAALEEQRMTVKKAVLEPYEAFEKVYKEFVSDKFKAADVALKGKIDSVEDGLRAEKESDAKDYFAELCAAYGIDFYTWDKSGIKVTLSTSLKSLKEQIQRGLSKIMDDLQIISKQQYKDEILAEFKQSLSLNQAITHVTDIHASMEREAAKRVEQAPIQDRQEEAIKKVEAIAPPEEVSPPPVKVAAPAEEIYTMAFRVTGSLEQLKALKQYITDSGIVAENLEV